MQSRKLSPELILFSEKRRPRRRRSSPRTLVALRLHDFARLFRARYGYELPNDDAGRDDLVPVLHHLASLSQPARRSAQWLELWAPWLTLGEQRTIIADAIIGARAWSADALAWRYRITKEQRTMLGLTTIGAIDQGKAARTKARRISDRRRKAEARRRDGVRPRHEYEEQGAAALKPWIAEGISRRTWYRRRRAADTSPSTA